MKKEQQKINSSDYNSHKKYDNKILSMREISEQLWLLLDNIDTLSDICKPTMDKPKSLMAFYNNTMKYVAKRFDLLKSDGYKIYTIADFEELPNSKSSLNFFDKDDCKR